MNPKDIAKTIRSIERDIVVLDKKIAADTKARNHLHARLIDLQVFANKEKP